MDRDVIHEQITEQLFQRLEETRFLHVPLMNRIEARLRTKEQLERYIALLVHKLEATNFRHEWLLDRIDQVMLTHERLERHERLGAPMNYWDAAEASLN